MAEDQEKEETEKKGSSSMMMIIALVVVLVAGGAAFFILQEDEKGAVQVEEPSAEYVVSDKMYQLKDGSYLRLGFSIVINSSQIENVKQIVEQQSPGRLPDGITMILGDKTREELINGTHKREAFSREIKKVLEERVFAEFNSKQLSSKEMIEVRDVLISVYVTQTG